MKRFLPVLGIIVVFVMLLLSATAYAGTGDVTITFWGQAAFKLESGGKTILTDPWITENTACTINNSCATKVKIEDIKKADLIFISHDHFDHVGDTHDALGNTTHAADTIAIAKQTGAIVVAEYETTQRLIAEGLPWENTLFGSSSNPGYGKPIGGPIDINIGTASSPFVITVVSTPAVHSSDSGVSVGWILKFPGGATVYHAGDTAIFGDMLIYGTLYPIDMALLPVGGYGTMDAVQAAQSLRLLTPKTVIPMHYGTFPMLAPDPGEFVALAKKIAPSVVVKVLQPGGQYMLQP